MCEITLRIGYSDWFNKKANSEARFPDREDTRRRWRCQETERKQDGLFRDEVIKSRGKKKIIAS